MGNVQRGLWVCVEGTVPGVGKRYQDRVGDEVNDTLGYRARGAKIPLARYDRRGPSEARNLGGQVEGFTLVGGPVLGGKDQLGV